MTTPARHSDAPDPTPADVPSRADLDWLQRDHAEKTARLTKAAFERDGVRGELWPQYAKEGAA